MKVIDILNIKIKTKGAILIEFALAIPFLISILYFALDAPKHKRWKTQMKNAAYQAASMIQNVSQSRDDKRITKQDCIYVARSWGMSIWGSGSKWIISGSYYPLGFSIGMRMFYVKGTSINKAKIIWSNYYTSISLTNYGNYSSGNATGGPSLMNGKTINTEYSVSDIHKDLRINQDEVKILTEIYIYANSSYRINSSTYAWGYSGSTSMPPSLFGFYLLKPKETVNYSTAYKGMFNTVIIFTPNPGLFSETPPS